DAAPAEKGAAAISTGPSRVRSSTGEPPPRSTIWGETSFGVPLKDSHGGPDWERWAADLVFLAEEATAVELAKLKEDNAATLQRLKVSDAVRYRALMHDLDRSEHGSDLERHPAESE